jgi:hypothetical protein
MVSPPSRLHSKVVMVGAGCQDFTMVGRQCSAPGVGEASKRLARTVGFAAFQVQRARLTGKQGQNVLAACTREWPAGQNRVEFVSGPDFTACGKTPCTKGTASAVPQ